MGAKRKHPNPLEPAVSEAVATLLTDLARENDWRAPDLKRKLSKFGQTVSPSEDTLHFYDYADFEADYSTIRKLLETAKPINDFHMWAFFLLLKFGMNSVVDRLGHYISVARIKPQKQLLTSLNDFFGSTDYIDFDSWKRLNGTYEFFRPSHLRPQSEIMVLAFQIGVADDLLHCTLSNTYTDRMDRERHDYFFGEITPCAGRTMAILRMEDRKADRIILHFDGVDHYDDGTVAGCDIHGIMLSVVGGGPSSAWPFFARRARQDSKISPHTVSAHTFSELPEDIRDTLNRGAVHWEFKNYPNPYQR